MSQHTTKMQMLATSQLEAPQRIDEAAWKDAQVSSNKAPRRKIFQLTMVSPASELCTALLTRFLLIHCPSRATVSLALISHFFVQVKYVLLQRLLAGQLCCSCAESQVAEAAEQIEQCGLQLGDSDGEAEADEEGADGDGDGDGEEDEAAPTAGKGVDEVRDMEQSDD